MRNRTPKRRRARAWSWLSPGLPLAVVALLFVVLAAPVRAQDDDEDEEDPFAGIYRKRGFYVVAMGNYMVTTEKSKLERDAERQLDALYGPPNNGHASDSWGFNGRAGYRAHERVAVETQFEFVNRIDVETDIGNLALRQDTEINLFALTGNLKGYVLSRGRVQPYVLAGAGWGRAQINPDGPGANRREDGFVGRFGAGVDLYGKPDIALTLEASYVVPTGKIDDLEYVSIGAGFMLRFFPGGY